MKNIITSIVVALVIVAVTIAFTSKKNGEDNTGNASGVSIENGVQIVDIRAKGGYVPRKSIAKAGIPTLIRFNTSGTFDCSAIVRIPSMNINKTLPPTGKTEIDIGIQSEGVFRGSCGMGMYPFEIEFLK